MATGERQGMQKKVLAFCLFNYFPYGGLQRDFLRIALKCQQMGAAIRVYTMRWEGPAIPGFDVQLIPTRGLTNHLRAKRFATQVQERLSKESADLTVGFNKMPGLDVYFASDVCFAEQVSKKNWLSRFFPRYRIYLEMEKAVFGPQSKTHILLLSNRQIEDFQRHYSLETNRFTLMPPGLDENFRVPDNIIETRKQVRHEFGLDENTFLLLHVGSAFKGKGMDRAIRSLASLSEPDKKRCFLLVAGKGDSAGFMRMATKLGVGKIIHFAGVRQDIPSLMAAADILIHPARVESAGMILLESIASSLPVICTAICGYTPFVMRASGGILLEEPFRQRDLDAALKKMLNREVLDQHRQSIRTYCKQNKLSGLHEKAAQSIMGVLP